MATATMNPARIIPAGTRVCVNRNGNYVTHAIRGDIAVPDTATASTMYVGYLTFNHMGYAIHVNAGAIRNPAPELEPEEITPEFIVMMDEKAAEQRAEIESENAAYRAEMERDAAHERAIMDAEMANARPPAPPTNDEPDFGTFEPAHTPRRAAPARQTPAAAPTTNANRCRRCRGTGNLPGFRHVEGGRCFRCGGTGRGR